MLRGEAGSALHDVLVAIILPALAALLGYMLATAHGWFVGLLE